MTPDVRHANSVIGSQRADRWSAQLAGAIVAYIFVSYSSSDRTIAETLATALRHHGHHVFRDADRGHGLVVGEEWRHRLFTELRAADAIVYLNTVAAQASSWCHTELAVSLEAGKRIYPIALAPLTPPHPLVAQLQSVTLDEGQLDAGIVLLLEQLRRDGLLDQYSRPRWHVDRPPYPGLAAFGPDDVAIFFGRNQEIRDIVDRVNPTVPRTAGEVVLVLGPSGAGKSSLVRAGLIPVLRRTGSGWLALDPFEPGLRPLDRLTDLVVESSPVGISTASIRQRMSTGGRSRLVHELLSARGRGERRLLISVDQCEQLLSSVEHHHREEFLSALTDLADNAPATVVLTTRQDRVELLQRLPGIGARLRYPVLVPPIDRTRLGEIIEGPARQANLSLEPGLTGQILDDAMRGEAADPVRALPLVAFVLREMYERMRSEGRTVLRSEDYRAVGGLDGAVARRTSQAEFGLTPDLGVVLDRLLVRLVTITEDRSASSVAVARYH